VRLAPALEALVICPFLVCQRAACGDRIILQVMRRAAMKADVVNTLAGIEAVET
jgi:hypothetical protein